MHCDSKSPSLGRRTSFLHWLFDRVRCSCSLIFFGAGVFLLLNLIDVNFSCSQKSSTPINQLSVSRQSSQDSSNVQESWGELQNLSTEKLLGGDYKSQIHLRKIMQAAADTEHNVAIVFANKPALGNLHNLIYSTATLDIPMNIIVIAFDESVCAETSIHFPMVACVPSESPALMEVSKINKPNKYKEIMRNKVNITKMILEHGYNVLSVDVDVVFFRNFFHTVKNLGEFDITSQAVDCHSLDDCFGNICGGLFYMKSNRKNIEVLSKALGHLDENFHQDSLNKAIMEVSSKAAVTIQIRPLSEIPFVDEYVYNCFQYNRDLLRHKLIAVHAATHAQDGTEGCVGLEAWREQEKTQGGKMQVMEKYGLLKYRFRVCTL